MCVNISGGKKTCFLLSSIKMEAAGHSEMSANFYTASNSRRLFHKSSLQFVQKDSTSIIYFKLVRCIYCNSLHYVFISIGPYCALSNYIIEL